MPFNTAIFSTALQAAKNRLQKALDERNEAQNKLAALNAEVPDLQRTIAALESQLAPPRLAHISEVVTMTLVEAKRAGLVSTQPVSPEISKYLLPQDLSGMGSVLESKPTGAQISEEELLPEPKGVPLIE